MITLLSCFLQRHSSPSYFLILSMHDSDTMIRCGTAVWNVVRTTKMNFFGFVESRRLLRNIRLYSRGRLQRLALAVGKPIEHARSVSMTWRLDDSWIGPLVGQPKLRILWTADFICGCEERGGACNHSNYSIPIACDGNVSRRPIAATRRLRQLPRGFLNIPLLTTRCNYSNRNLRCTGSIGYALSIS